MGSMGKRRGRRTRSSPGSLRRRAPAGPVEWPGLTGPSPYTFEGSLRQMSAVSSNLARATGARGVTARFLWLLAFPPAAIAVLVWDVARAIARRVR